MVIGNRVSRVILQSLVPRKNAEFVGHQKRIENESGSKLDTCVLAVVA